MSATNKPLPTALGGLPAPGYYNQTADEYENTEGDGGAPWVQPLPALTLSGLPTSGASIAANGTICTAYTVSKTGYIVAAVTLANGAISSGIQVTRDNGTFWASEGTLLAGYEAIFRFPVVVGDTFQARLVTATTAGCVRMFFTVH